MINCHSHTFTAKNVPPDFAPFGLVTLIQNRITSPVIISILKNIDPLDSDGILARTSRFMKHISFENQRDVFLEMKRHYPSDTKFVVLGMDFDYCGMRHPAHDAENQMYELYSLSQEFPNIIPFVPVDPRRPNLMRWVTRWIETKGFGGIKLYPSLGFEPTDSRLMPVYKYANDNRLPIISHCGGTSVRGKNVNPADAKYLLSPGWFIPILRKYPDLKLDLAHFGGVDEWNGTLQVPDVKSDGWIDSIRSMIYNFPNIYTDISYTMFSEPLFVNYLKILLEDQRILDRVLFGTDFYMVDFEDVTEKQVCVELRSMLGENIWNIISDKNPQKFLTGG